MTTVFYHNADYDGIFCREIARKFLPPDTVLIGWDFGYNQMTFPSEGDVYVLDLPADRLFSTKPDPARTIWIDHHKSSIDANSFPYRGYRIDGVAACRLAWQWLGSNFLYASSTAERSAHWNMWMAPKKKDFLNREVNEPLAVRLAGEYDIWDHRDEQQDITFQYGLDAQKEIDWARLLSNFGDTVVKDYLHDGRSAQQCLAKRSAQIVTAKGFDLRFEGFTFLALNTPAKGSLQFDAGVQPQHDGCLAFSFNGRNWSISMYGADGKRDLDFSVIAVKYGGGGHRQACGFQTTYLPWLPSNEPYEE